MASNPLDHLRGEVIATQLVVQRILANIAESTGDFDGTLRRAHTQCLSDLEKLDLRVDGTDSPDIRAHAEAALDRMHTYLRKQS